MTDEKDPADRPATEPRHDITDPNAPDGYKCGDPACKVHGLRARMHRELRAAGASETTASAVSGYRPATERDSDLDNIHGPALIAHTREQAETVINCLDSLAGLWRLAACPDSRAHEAAQGAAPLDADRLATDLRTHFGEMLSPREYDAILAIVRANSEGAAPRAEGLDVEAVLLRILTVCGYKGDDPTDATLAFQMIRDTVDDALARLSPRAEGLTVGKIASALADCPDLDGWTLHERDRLAADLHVALARLSRPSDEREGGTDDDR